MSNRSRFLVKVWASLLMVAALTISALWAQDQLPRVWFNANGQAVVKIDNTGNIMQTNAAATTTTSGLALPTSATTLTIANSAGTVLGGYGSDGFPRIGSNANGTITGSGAGTYTVTFNTSATDTSYIAFLQATGTSNTTACTLNVSSLTTTGFTVTPSAPTAFPTGRNIFWAVQRTN